MPNFIQQLAAMGRPIGRAIADPINSGKDALVSALMEMTARGNPSAKPAAPTLGGANASWSPTQLGGYAQSQMVPMDMLADDYSDAQSAVQKSMQHGEIRHPLQGLEHLTGVLAAKSAEGRARKELLGARDRRGRTMRALAAAKTPAEFLRIASLSGDEEMQAKAASIVASQLFADDNDKPAAVPGMPGHIYGKTDAGEWTAKPLAGIDPAQQQLEKIPASAQEDLSQKFNMLAIVDRMDQLLQTNKVDDEYLPQAWKGPMSELSLMAGWPESPPELKEFDALRGQMKLAAQSIIKGTPSNFDVQVVIDTLPNYWVPHSVNMQRIGASKALTTQLIKDSIAYQLTVYGGVPKALAERAMTAGIDVNALQGLWKPGTDPLAGTAALYQKISESGILDGETPEAKSESAPANTSSGEERWKQILYGGPP